MVSPTPPFSPPVPPTFKIAKGTSLRILAYGIYSDGSERILNAVWSVSPNPNSIASIISNGLAIGLSAGTVTVNATDSATSISGSATLIVTDATLTGIVVSPVGQTIAPFTQLFFTALGEFSDGTTQTVTQDVNWSSTAPAVATVHVTGYPGLATGVAAGSTMIQASLGGSVTGTAPLTVSSASLISIAFNPESAGLPIGSSLSVQAIGTFSDGTQQQLHLGPAWSITPNNGSIATIAIVDHNGARVAGVAAGSAMLKVQVGAVSQTAVLTVQSVTSLAITPNPVTIAQGTSRQFKATATLADGTTRRCHVFCHMDLDDTDHRQNQLSSRRTGNRNRTRHDHNRRGDRWPICNGTVNRHGCNHGESRDHTESSSKCCSRRNTAIHRHREIQ